MSQDRSVIKCKSDPPRDHVSVCGCDFISNACIYPVRSVFGGGSPKPSPKADGSFGHVDIISSSAPLTSQLLDENGVKIIISDMLTDGSFWKHFSIDKSSGDGHCLVYSVIRSIADQHDVHLYYDSLLDDIRLETRINIDEYKQFMNSNSEFDLIRLMCAYIDAKNYQTRFADIMPMIISNIIRMPIVIVEKQDSDFTFHIIHCRSSTTLDRLLYIYKCGLHYDALLHLNRLVTIPSVVNSVVNSVAHEEVSMSSPLEDNLKVILQYLKFIAWNVYGLDEMKLSLHRQFLRSGDIVLCLETWADKDSNFELSSEFESIPLPRAERHKKAMRGSGGICLFIRKSLLNKVVFVHKKYKDFLIWLRFDHVKLGISKDIYMACVYVAPERSTHNKEDVFFAIQTQIASLPADSFYLTSGDLNGRTACIPDYVSSELFSGNDCVDSELSANHLNYEKMSVLNEYACLDRISQDTVRTPFGDSIIGLCRSTHMIILNGRSGNDKGVGSFTCVNSRGKSVVDYVLCSPGLFQLIEDFTVHPLTPESDHKPLSFRLKCNFLNEKDKPVNKSRWHCVYRYKWSDKDLQDIGDKISKVSDDVDPQNKTYIDFKSAISDLKSPSEIGNLYTHHITSTIDSIIQKKKVLPPKDRPKWFDIECRTQRNLLVSLNRENESITNSQVNFSGERRQYVALRQRKKREFHRSKRNEIDYAFKFDKSSMWPLIKRMSSDTSLYNMPNKNDFYDFFYAKSQKTINPDFSYDLEKEALAYIESTYRNPVIDLKPTIELEILNADFTEEEIESTISKLKNNKSPGPDGIVAEFLKSCKETFARDLTMIFNYFLEHREFPDVWAEGYRSPVFKAGIKGDCNNYRGITVLCIFEKIFESACLNRLEFVSEAFCKFDRYNTGFMKGCRTGDNNFTLMGMIQRQLFLGRSLNVVHIDFSQAFDLIIRCILFYKLNKSGFSGRMIDTLIDLYRKTTYRVKVGGKISDIIDEHLGVNQGGPASPWLFKEYLSDLKDYLDEYTGICIDDEILVHEAFADDMFLLSDQTDNSQKQLDGLSKFCRPNQMLVNVIKSKLMVYGNDDNVVLKFQGKSIEQVKKYKSLGTLFSSISSFSSNMFKDNTEFLNDKARKAIFGLQKRTKDVDLYPTQKFYLFETIIEPILLYGSDIWGAFPSCLEDINKIFLWYTKCNLGVKTTTNDTVVVGESGMIPPRVKCHANVILNFIRLNNLNSNSIVKKTFLQQQEMNEIGAQCWYSRVLDIAKGYNIDPLSHTFNDDTKYKIRQTCYNSFKNSWKSDLLEKPKLRTYRLLKDNFGTEKYLSLVTKKKFRNAITRLRSSSHTLEIERGRWTNPITPVENRLCPYCNLVEDEIHFLFQCELYTNDRVAFFNKVNQYTPGFLDLEQPDKFLFLFTNENSNILTWLGKFIYDSFINRTIYCNPELLADQNN